MVVGRNQDYQLKRSSTGVERRCLMEGHLVKAWEPLGSPTGVPE